MYIQWVQGLHWPGPWWSRHRLRGRDGRGKRASSLGNGGCPVVATETALGGMLLILIWGFLRNNMKLRRGHAINMCHWFLMCARVALTWAALGVVGCAAHWVGQEAGALIAKTPRNSGRLSGEAPAWGGGVGAGSPKGLQGPPSLAGLRSCPWHCSPRAGPCPVLSA